MSRRHDTIRDDLKTILQWMSLVVLDRLCRALLCGPAFHFAQTGE